ncbi:hypothetical protein COU37_05360 [Candidatus Micrarchaeota archaeon CG10_big_fil_rev_8_21_14_0_10_45_29]|nr:MAG: hypothetical protein COU37_05360 [Candidatus Micrarchaeota archaeon CG10_big_fil_rev_8_21_14_0_10_45_29]
MATVAHLVQKYVREHPNLELFMQKDLVSFHRLARYIKPAIEAESGGEVQASSIVMALSRMREKMGVKEEEGQKNPGYKSLQISLRSDAMQIDIRKGANTQKRLIELQKIASSSPEDVLSITQSQHEASIVLSQKHETKAIAALKGEKILNIEKNLSLLFLRFGEDILYQPGFFDRVIRELSWEGINIFQVISTLTELIVVLKEEQASKAYEVLRRKLKKRAEKV